METWGLDRYGDYKLNAPVVKRQVEYSLVIQTPINLSYDGGGVVSKCPPPLFLFVKTIEKVIRLCTGLKKQILSGSFEDRAIFHVSQLSYYGGGLMCPLQID